MAGRGSVTPLSEILPVDELVKVADHIDDAIREHRSKIEELNRFAEENKALQKLIQELPHNVSHNIMVPFGRAAFFPGKLVHTNEMMVLLGEGYYAERSAKQTVDILTRRAKFLDSNIQSIHAQITDLQAEASFASNAVEEVAAGVVDIREDYVEQTENQFEPVQDVTEIREPYVETTSEPVKVKINNKYFDDSAHDEVIARLNALEALEEAAQKAEDAKVHALEEAATKEDDMEFAYISEEDTAPVSSSAPSVRTPADFIKFEEWKINTWEQSENGRRGKGKIEKKVTFNLPNEKSVAGQVVHSNQASIMNKPQQRFNTAFMEQRSSDPSAKLKVEEKPVISHQAVKSNQAPVLRERYNTAFTGSIVERSPLSSPVIPKVEEKREKRVSIFKQRLEESRT